MITTATIARDILVKAAAGVIDTDSFPGAAFTNDQLAVIWYSSMPGVTYHVVDEAAVDVAPTQSTSLDVARAAATLVYWDLMIANGQLTVPQINTAVNINAYLVPSSMTGGSGEIDLKNGLQSLPPPGVVNDDPFAAFPDLYLPVPDKWEQAAMAALLAAGYSSPTQAQIDAAANAIEISLTAGQASC